MKKVTIMWNAVNDAHGYYIMRKLNKGVYQNIASKNVVYYKPNQIVKWRHLTKGVYVMNKKVLHTLEYFKIIEMLVNEADSPLAKETADNKIVSQHIARVVNRSRKLFAYSVVGAFDRSSDSFDPCRT